MDENVRVDLPEGGLFNDLPKVTISKDEVSPVILEPISINRTNVANNQSSNGDMSKLEDVSYSETYNDSKNALKTIVLKTDRLVNMLEGQLDFVQSNNYRNKSDQMSLLTSTINSLLSTEVNAIKEINKVTTDAHNLDMKRFKDLSAMNIGNQVNDVDVIANMYNAMMKGSGGMMMSSAYNGAQLVNRNPLYTIGLSDLNIGNGTFENPQTIEQNTFNSMVYENNPNIKTVVVYNQDTNESYFDCIDVTNGNRIPNVDLPDRMFLEDMVIDKQNLIAKNKNINMVYDLILVGGGMNNY